MPYNVRPPTQAPLVALADRCVQCGLCLPACPTYGVERTEAESPRGRIALARAVALGTIDLTPAGTAHLDHCLGCRNCEAVCPAGVRYGELLIRTRALQRALRGRRAIARCVAWLAAHPRMLNGLVRLYQRVHRFLPARLRRLPRLGPRPEASRLDIPMVAAASTPAALFTGCIALPYESALREAATRLCAAVGVALHQPAGQTCCGALHQHEGDTARGERLAAAQRAAFANAGTVLTLASGCHDAVARSLKGVASTCDAIAYLAARSEALRFRTTHERVALHLPCTQRNVVKSVPALRALLARVPELEVIELDAGYGCCGAAGMQMLQDPGRAAAYRRPLLEQFASSGATRLLSANIGCRLHFANATALSVEHPLEFLAGRLDRSSLGPPP